MRRLRFPRRRWLVGGALTAVVLTAVALGGVASSQVWPRQGHAAAAAETLNFAPPVSYLGNRPVVAVAIGDFNGDGKPDLMATAAPYTICNSSYQCTDYPSAIYVLLNNGNGAFIRGHGSPVPVPDDQYQFFGWVVVGDFNGDGKLDAAVYDGGNNVIYVLLGNGDGTFQSPTAATTIPFPGSSSEPFYPNSLVVADFNRDGKLDLATAQGSSRTIGSVTVLLGHGDGTFPAPDPTPGPGSNTFATGGDSEPSAVVVGDFNGDGKLDLVTLNSQFGPCCLQPLAAHATSSYSVLLGDGAGALTLLGGAPTALSNLAAAITAGDFNGDGKLDLAIANDSSSSMTSTLLSTLLGHGNGTFTETSSAPIAFDGYPPSYVETGDFNGDGKLDLVVTTRGGHAEVMLSNGHGTFQSPVPFACAPLYPISLPVAVGDLNTDGLPDLVIAEYSGIAGQVAVLLNTSTFVLPTGTTLSANPASTVVGQNVTLNATVAGTTTTTGIPTGTVTFQDGASTLGTATLSGGTASLSTTALAVGTHTITARYSGNAHFQPSASAPQTVIVGVNGQDVAGGPVGSGYPPYNPPAQQSGGQGTTASGTGQTQQPQPQQPAAHPTGAHAGALPWTGPALGLLLLLAGLAGLGVVFYRASQRRPALPTRTS
jgi:hypothetical protein